MTDSHPEPCRICGRPGRLYLSGRWCPDHFPGLVNPDPPPVAPRAVGVTQTAVHEAHRLHTAWRVANTRAQGRDTEAADTASDDAIRALTAHLDSTGLAGSRYDPRTTGARP